MRTPLAFRLTSLGRLVVLLCLPGPVCLGADGPATRPAAAPTTAPAERLETLAIAGETFHLKVAADPESRRRGLMGVTEIKADRGMLFVFPRASRRTFWMAECPADMDVVFLDDRDRVTAVHEMKAEAPRRRSETEWQYHRRLPRYPSGRPVRFAIELRAGTARRLGLRPGAVIPLDRPRLMRRAR